MDAATGYELLDFGNGARLERFGPRLVARPFPGARGRPTAANAWVEADLRFERGRGWTAERAAAWEIGFESLTLELRPTDSGQVGLFPEHAGMLPWLRDRIAERPDGAVLHLFAHTGLITLALAAAGAAVTHVDASRPTVAWARRNAARSGLADRPVRWIIDDALAYAMREARRGHRYAGVVLDPPTYGHSGKRDWRAGRDLEALLDACRAILDPDGFVLLTSHTPELEPHRLGAFLAGSLGRLERTVEVGRLGLRARDGRPLDLGAFARWPAGGLRPDGESPASS